MKKDMMPLNFSSTPGFLYAHTNGKRLAKAEAFVIPRIVLMYDDECCNHAYPDDGSRTATAEKSGGFE